MSVSNCVPQELEAASMWVIDLYVGLNPLVSYRDIANISYITKGSLANLCSQGDGPSGGIILGKKKVFPRLSVVLWLWERSKN